MKIIDVHNHPDWHGHDLTKFLVNMVQYHIEKTWLLSWECAEAAYLPSYLHAIPAFAKKFLKKYQDRVCCARDCFDSIHQKFLNSLALPDRVLRRIYAENSERILEDCR